MSYICHCLYIISYKHLCILAGVTVSYSSSVARCQVRQCKGWRRQSQVLDGSSHWRAHRRRVLYLPQRWLISLQTAQHARAWTSAEKVWGTRSWKIQACKSSGRFYTVIHVLEWHSYSSAAWCNSGIFSGMSSIWNETRWSVYILGSVWRNR